MQLLRAAGALAIMTVGACAYAQTSAQSTPRRVILYIGDGAGVGYWTAAAVAADDLAVEEFSVVGLVNTASSDSRVTDSAASATAFASGVRTYNGAIGVDPDTVPLPTVLELARDRGMATGLIATSSITHATPAAFAAHTPSRQNHFDIARQLAEFGLDVIMGGGYQYFDAQTRPDSVDLVGGGLGRYSHARSAEQLRQMDFSSTDKVAGLFAVEHMPAAPDRTPSLPHMTSAALEILDRDPDGFFLMVESSQPDWLGHDNEPLSAITAEMLDFDRSIRVGLEYQDRHPETLIVVVADHETGGLSVQLAFSSVLVARYTSGSHTAELIPLFASGPGAEEFGGIIDNWEIGRLLLNHVCDTHGSVAEQPSR